MESMKDSDNVLAFDFGTRRIGVAVGHASIGRGRGIHTVQVRQGEPDFDEISRLVQTWNPERFVVGLPNGNCPSGNSLNKQILKFGDQLTERFGLPVAYVDETLSTEESNFRISREGIRVRKHSKTDIRNKVSAEIILETYFSQVNG